MRGRSPSAFLKSLSLRSKISRNRFRPFSVRKKGAHICAKTMPATSKTQPQKKKNPPHRLARMETCMLPFTLYVYAASSIDYRFARLEWLFLSKEKENKQTATSRLWRGTYLRNKYQTCREIQATTYVSRGFHGVDRCQRLRRVGTNTFLELPTRGQSKFPTDHNSPVGTSIPLSTRQWFRAKAIFFWRFDHPPCP